MQPQRSFVRYAKKPIVFFVIPLVIILVLVLWLLVSHVLPLMNALTVSPSVTVTVNRTHPIGTSQFSPGITHMDASLDDSGDGATAAVSHIKSLIKQAIPFENTHIMGWGAPDPWPDPNQAEPNNWSYLDQRLQLIQDTGGTAVLTLCEAPWWMKGQLQADGTTHMITQAEEWSDTAYKARVLDNAMGAWLHLVQRVAERYMAPPYNVRYFQVWNELKGYYNPQTNAYDSGTSAGNTAGSNATHGYTYMYNQVYDRLMQVANSLHIPADQIKVGGPYAPIETWAAQGQSQLSDVSKAYGTYDKRSLSVIQDWLQHKAGAGFITIDGGNTNRDNTNITDPFTASEKFADIVRWIRSLDNTRYPGAATLPIWWAEWYASPYTNAMDAQYNDAVKSYAIMELIKAGGSVTLSWGGLSFDGAANGLWSSPTDGNGDPLPWYSSYKAFKDYFAAGTGLYQTVVSKPDRIAALASSHKVMLVNKTAATIGVRVNDTVVVLSPYQVQTIDY